MNSPVSVGRASQHTGAGLAPEGLDPDLVSRPAHREVSEFVHAAFL
jgi:hypothetical protein